jgi:hypothetical protein
VILFVIFEADVWVVKLQSQIFVKCFQNLVVKDNGLIKCKCDLYCIKFLLEKFISGGK